MASFEASNEHIPVILVFPAASRRRVHMAPRYDPGRLAEYGRQDHVSRET